MIFLCDVQLNIWSDEMCDEISEDSSVSEEEDELDWFDELFGRTDKFTSEKNTTIVLKMWTRLYSKVIR